MKCKRCGNENVHGDYYCRECETDLNLYGRYNPKLCLECQSSQRNRSSQYCADCKQRLILKRVTSK